MAKVGTVVTSDGVMMMEQTAQEIYISYALAENTVKDLSVWHLHAVYAMHSDRGGRCILGC